LCPATGVTAETIARALLAEDRSQIEYYTAITRDMVGRVLRNRGVVERDGATYHLRGIEQLTPEQIAVLRAACERKLAEYVAKRGAMIWDHRRRSKGYISGTLKYDVLKAAKFHCELCGIPADERALEVDHIVPRNTGGSNEPSNLQALCYRCNAMKRDRNATDFRAIRAAYRLREAGCVFCELPADRIVEENALAVVIEDEFPVTPLHTLVIPKRHVTDYFDLLLRPRRGGDEGVYRPLRTRPGAHPGARLYRCGVQRRRQYRGGRRPNHPTLPPPSHPSSSGRRSEPARRRPPRHPRQGRLPARVTSRVAPKAP